MRERIKKEKKKREAWGEGEGDASLYFYVLSERGLRTLELLRIYYTIRNKTKQEKTGLESLDGVYVCMIG